MESPLPQYSLRISKKAIRPSLRIKVGLGLEVVLPENYNESQVPKLLEHFRPWIEKHYPRIMSESESRKRNNLSMPPLGFFISGGHEYFYLLETPPKRQKLEAEAQKQKIICPREVALQQLLMPEKFYASADKRLSWLKERCREKAKERLSPQLLELAKVHSFNPKKITYRFQKSRWGSCSRAGSISLNVNLIFLPSHLSRYILIHELCHLRVMSHSQKYWKEVFAIEPRALEYDKGLRGAWKYLPDWII